MASCSMAPLSQSSAKKQQSISSFFTRPAAPKVAAAPESPLSKSAYPIRGGDTRNENGNLFLDEDEPSSSIQNIRKAKRTSIEAGHRIESSDEEDVTPGTKRRRKDQDLPPSSAAAESLDVPLHPIDGNGGRKARASDRTSRFLYSSSPPNEDGEAEERLSQDEKDRLHQRFVKKLGKPDSIADIKRRNRFISAETEEAAEDDDGGSDADELSTSSKKKAVATKKGGSKLTPMERQVLDIKAKNPDTLLVIEVGYKFRFFGEDARVAAKELHIVCIPGKFRYDEHISEAHLDRFASASIPVHRLHVHVRRLVAAGHKVGIVRQLETAALKAAGDNRNAPFVRKLTNLYTKGTYIDDVDNLDEKPEASNQAPSTGYLLCITETNSKGWGTDEKVHVGIVAVQPATGDVIYDDFDDGFMRSEIETRLLHIAPCEFLIVGELSKSSEKLVQHLSASKTNVFGDKARVERVERPKTMTALAYTHVSNFYAEKAAAHADDKEAKAALLDKVLKLNEDVTICLSAMITHLSDYGLEHVFDLTKYFQSFSARSHMLLNGTTLSSLEIYQNQTDHSERGSLFWTLNRTKTKFGKRLLRKWVGRPLLDREKLKERIAAIEEIKDGDQTAMIEKIRSLLSKISTDLEKSLLRIYYGKCTRPEVLSVLQTLQRIGTEFASIQSAAEVGFQSAPLNEAVASLPTISSEVVAFLEKINAQAAKDDDKYAFFREEEETDAITEHKLGIASVEHELDAHRPVAAGKVKKSKVNYVTVSGIEYLIEIENNQLKNVPASWQKISGTKKVSRFHTPEVVRMIRERDQHKEALAAACDSAFKNFLNEISSKYQELRDCIQLLALLDCLFSLAAVASQPGYVKPEYTEETCIAIKQGRHPMVEQLLLDNYVPNDTDLATDRTRALLITGPNMGGKSSYVRHVALLTIMGQIGSYVPAASARLGMLDAVFTRMGAADNMMAGESTFMVELSETADVLKQATPRSLVILDELGRGTSTHDGVAIAQAVLDHVVRQTRCLTLFITHYQHLAAMARGFAQEELRNVHMRFTESGTSGQDITFLYEVGEGIAHRSYGLNVARLANVPPPILELAQVKSHELEAKAQEKRLAALSRSMVQVLGGADANALETLVGSLEEL